MNVELIKAQYANAIGRKGWDDVETDLQHAVLKTIEIINNQQPTTEEEFKEWLNFKQGRS